MSDFPDWFSGGNWPDYGTTYQDASGLITVAADGAERLIYVVGRGYIVHGYWYITGVIPVDSRVELRVDGEYFVSARIGGMRDACIYNGTYSVVRLNRYDGLVKFIGCSIRPGISFRETIEMRYNELDSQDTDVHAGISCYLRQG